jgi:hypothetical protein
MLAVAFLAHGALWLKSVHRLDALVEEQAQGLRGQGWRVVLGPAWPQGWPGHAGLRFGPTSIEANGFAWRAGWVVIDTPLRWPDSMSGTISGPAHVRADGQQIRFGSGTALAVVSKDLQLEIWGGSATLVGTDVGIAHAFEAETLQLRLGPEGLALAARHLKPLDAAHVHGQVVDTLALHGSAMPPLRFAGDLRSAAMAWRQAGGVVDVSDIALTTGRARALGTCRIWLDGALQPRLDGTMHVTGYEAGLDELATTGVLTRQTVVAAKAVLDLLAAPALDGGADVPVQIADGALAVARFPLLRMPVLDWSAAPLGP